MSLAHTPLQTIVRIAGVRGRSTTSVRLMEMGMIEGASVCILGRAPLGGPLHVRLGDYELSVRASEADLVDVCPL